jgi:hypothetical protein
MCLFSRGPSDKTLIPVAVCLQTKKGNAEEGACYHRAVERREGEGTQADHLLSICTPLLHSAGVPWAKRSGQSGEGAGWFFSCWCVFFERSQSYSQPRQISHGILVCSTKNIFRNFRIVRIIARKVIIRGAVSCHTCHESDAASKPTHFKSCKCRWVRGGGLGGRHLFVIVRTVVGIEAAHARASATLRNISAPRNHTILFSDWGPQHKCERNTNC